MRSFALVFTALLLTATILAQQPHAAKGDGLATTFTLASTAFNSGAAIPDTYTCKGDDASPLLAWTGNPFGIDSYALIMDDPDAPSGTFVHWVIWNLPPALQLLPKDIIKSGTLPNGARQGRNDFGNVGYSGPCPPAGKMHRYYFRLYALNTKLKLEPGATRRELDAAMKGHIIGKAEHMGTYKK